MYARTLDILSLTKTKSCFLFGARSTGKTSLVQAQLKDSCLYIDLLKSDYFFSLSNRPQDLENIIEESKKTLVVIDEIQKIPMLLDEVHRLIEAKKIRFLLTGSSARKLKRGGGNLLAGRAKMAYLYPLSYSEITNFNLNRYIHYGGIPSIYLSQEPEEDLSSYTITYLKEEIQAEGLIRKLIPFHRFLKVAALSNGQIINYANIGSDAGVPASTVKDYFQLLSDTLVGDILEPWIQSKKRKAIETPKFFFFDIGVTHSLAGTKIIDRNSSLYGQSFEHFIYMELKSYLAYRRKNLPLCFWRSTHDHEVDFIIGDSIAVEVKATRKITPRNLRNLKCLQEENMLEKFFLISQDEINKKSDGIHVVHWKKFLDDLWQDKIL